MSPIPRHEALRNISNGPVAPLPQGRERVPLTELFGSRVFNDAVQRRRLRPDAYQALRRTIDDSVVTGTLRADCSMEESRAASHCQTL